MAMNILEKIKINGELQEIIAKSNGEYVTVTYSGLSMKLNEALAKIVEAAAGAQTAEDVEAAIKAEIDKLVGTAPQALDTIYELAEAVQKNQGLVETIQQAITNKADKEEFEQLKETVDGLGDLAEKSEVGYDDLDDTLQGKIDDLEGDKHDHDNMDVLEGITEDKVAEWDDKAEKDVATANADGLMAAADKKRFDAMGGVYYGATAPETDMKNGDLFIKIVSEE